MTINFNVTGGTQKARDYLKNSDIPTRILNTVLESTMDCVHYGVGFVLILDDYTFERFPPMDVTLNMEQGTVNYKKKVYNISEKRHDVYFLKERHTEIDDDGNILG